MAGIQVKSDNRRIKAIPALSPDQDVVVLLNQRFEQDLGAIPPVRAPFHPAGSHESDVTAEGLPLYGGAVEIRVAGPGQVAGLVTALPVKRHGIPVDGKDIIRAGGLNIGQGPLFGPARVLRRPVGVLHPVLSFQAAQSGQIVFGMNLGPASGDDQIRAIFSKDPVYFRLHDVVENFYPAALLLKAGGQAEQILGVGLDKNNFHRITSSLFLLSTCCRILLQ